MESAPGSSQVPTYVRAHKTDQLTHPSDTSDNVAWQDQAEREGLTWDDAADDPSDSQNIRGFLADKIARVLSLYLRNGAAEITASSTISFITGTLLVFRNVQEVVDCVSKIVARFQNQASNEAYWAVMSACLLLHTVRLENVIQNMKKSQRRTVQYISQAKSIIEPSFDGAKGALHGWLSHISRQLSEIQRTLPTLTKEDEAHCENTTEDDLPCIQDLIERFEHALPDIAGSNSED